MTAACREEACQNNSGHKSNKWFWLLRSPEAQKHSTEQVNWV